MDNEVDFGDPFLTVDERGNPVDRRILDPRATRLIFDAFVTEDSTESDRRSRLLDMYNLNKPYNDPRMKALGLSNLANFNTGDLRGFVDARIGVIADLALDTVPLVELRPHPANLAGPQAARFSEIIADEFSSAVRGTNKLLPCLASMFRECDLFGLGPVTWASPVDYAPVPLRRGQIKFRMDGPVCSSEHEIFMFETSAAVHYFSRVFRNEKAAKAEGWNPKAVRDFLVDTYVSKKPPSANPGDTTSTSTRESQLIEMRQNRWLETNQFMTLKLMHAYIKEGDGRIRHTICSPVAGVEDFLFDKEGAYDSMDECLLWLMASAHEFEARGVRGAASMVAPLADINNRLTCQMYDLGFRMGSITLVSNNPGQQHQSNIVERGPYTVIPGDLMLSPAQFQSSNVQQLASLRDLGTNIGYNNATGQRGGGGAAPERMFSGSERKTEDEVIAQQRAKANSEHALFAARVLVLDKLFLETFRRFIKLAAGSSVERKAYPEINDFLQRCTLQGVPEAAIKNSLDLFTVRTNRILVTGGGEAQAGILAQLLGSFGGGFDEPGRNLMLRDIVRFRLGTKCADRYRPEVGRDQAPSDAVSFAVLENGALQRREAAVVGSDQLHWSHIPVHMQVLGQIMDLYRQNPQSITEPQQALDALLAASQHIQEHLKFGSAQPGMKDIAKKVEAQIAGMAPVIKGLTMMAGTQDRQRRAAAKKQEQEMLALQQAAEAKEQAVQLHKIDTDAQLKARGQDLDHQVKLLKVRQDSELAAAEAESRQSIADQTRRMEQGAAILGFDKEGPGAPVFPGPDEAEGVNYGQP